MTAPTPLSTQFPNTQSWPVVPPDEHWLKRWHWLRDEDGFVRIAAWVYKFGWHWDWSGKPDPEDMQGWTYIAPAEPPKEPPPKEPVATGWVVKRIDGDLVIGCGPDMTEAKIWETALGWPSPDEIEWHKSSGARAFRVEVREIEE